MTDDHDMEEGSGAARGKSRSPSPVDIPMPKSDPDLFFPASDSEDEDYVDDTPEKPRAKAGPSKVKPKTSNGSSTFSRPAPKARAMSADSDIVAYSPVKRLPNATASASASTSGPSRKRTSPSQSPPAVIPSDFTGGYLGEFVCEGWSLSKGKGYCQPGTKITFERPKPKVVNTAEADAKLLERSKEKLGPARLVNGRMVHGKGAPVKTKQATLGSMMAKKAATAPPPAGKKGGEKKTVVDQIIRFRNERGFEVGRLSVSEAGFLVHLLDTGISEFSIDLLFDAQIDQADYIVSLSGHVIDCPTVLLTGATILLSVRVYLTREAFVRVQKAGRKDEGSFWQEQKETNEEEAMRYRKDALGSLFSELRLSFLVRSEDDVKLTFTGRIGVKPIRSNALLLAQKKNGKAEINEKSLQHFSDRPKLASRNNSSSKRDSSPSKRSDGSGSKDKGKKSAKNSDGEDEGDEGSGDEAEKLDEEQMDEIDTIYRK